MILCTLKDLLEQNNKTQSEVSSTTGITRPTLLSLIRNDNQSIKYETINKLCNYFNIDMSELLIYSPVKVELKEILIEDFPFSIYIDLEDGETSYSVSVIYDIDGIKFEFDTNLNVTKYTNSLKPSNKVFFSSIIYKDEMIKLESKGFDTNFIKKYNDAIDLDSLIKNKLNKLNLNLDFEFKNYDVIVSSMERSKNSLEENYLELEKSLSELLNLMNEKEELSQKDSQMFKNLIDNIKNKTNNWIYILLRLIML